MSSLKVRGASSGTSDTLLVSVSVAGVNDCIRWVGKGWWWGYGGCYIRWVSVHECEQHSVVGCSRLSLPRCYGTGETTNGYLELGQRV